MTLTPSAMSSGTPPLALASTGTPQVMIRFATSDPNRQEIEGELTEYFFLTDKAHA